MLPFKSLNAATTTGPGAAVDLESPSKLFTAQIVATGAVTNVTVILDGSLDGENWINLGVEGGLAAAGSTLLSTPSNTHHVRYVRANVKTLTGSGPLTVTCYVVRGA